MRIIYTSVDGLRIEGVEVRGLDKLSKIKREWVLATQKKLLFTTVLPEKISARMLTRFDDQPIRQAYFMIRKRSYFLDFFFPHRMLAIEIDGGYHKTRKDIDRRRDADFRSIGIRTIRIMNKDVMSGRLFDKIFQKLYR